MIYVKILKKYVNFMFVLCKNRFQITINSSQWIVVTICKPPLYISKLLSALNLINEITIIADHRTHFKNKVP